MQYFILPLLICSYTTLLHAAAFEQCCSPRISTSQFLIGDQSRVICETVESRYNMERVISGHLLPVKIARKHFMLIQGGSAVERFSAKSYFTELISQAKDKPEINIDLQAWYDDKSVQLSDDQQHMGSNDLIPVVSILEMIVEVRPVRKASTSPRQNLEHVSVSPLRILPNERTFTTYGCTVLELTNGHLMVPENMPLTQDDLASEKIQMLATIKDFNELRKELSALYPDLCALILYDQSNL